MSGGGRLGRKRIHRPTALAALGALVAALAVVAGPQPANALPSECSLTAPNVYRWTGAIDSDWNNGANWEHGSPATPGAPNDLSGPASAVACIGSGSVVITVVVQLASLFLDGNLTIQQGAGLFVNGSTPPSEWGPASVVEVRGALGGTGVIVAHGKVNVVAGTQGAVLASVSRPGGATYGGTPGKLVVEADGVLLVQGLGLALYTRYQVEVRGLLQLEPGAWMTADYGTSLTVQPGGRFVLNGDGGYYQGFAVNNYPPSVVTNNGTLSKTGGTNTSVVDATYVQGQTGQVVVACCAALALPDESAISARVSPGMGLATGACGGQATGLCTPTVNPALDTMSVDLDVPATNPQAAGVLLQELATVTMTVDSKAIGNEVQAHADQLVADPAHPATLTLRLSQADVMATPLAEVQVAHTDDAGHQTQIPDCVSGALPAGVPSCIVRPVTRTSQNTFVTVLTTQTSRWHLRRNKPGEPGDQTPPTAVRGMTVDKAAQPYDGSRLKVTWTPPANDGGAAVTAYRVYLDGKLAVTVTKSPGIVPNPGVGLHKVKVTAVNLLGEGPAVAGKITLPPLSKPRHVEDLQGAKGGKLTAGATWIRPKDSGGLVLKGYQMVVVNKAGKVVAKAKVGAAKHQLLVTLKKGSYRFKVRARNADGKGPWSAWTDWVSPR